MKGFGIYLEPLSEANLELVRQWRNSVAIAQYMEYQKQISSEAQIAWFRSLQLAYYFVIYAANSPCGLIDLKHINLETKSAEAGLFIGDARFLGTGIALGASILVLDFAFDELHLETINAKMHQDNLEAKQYNQLLGFQRVENLNDRFEFWELTRSVYLKNRPRLVEFLK